MHCPSVQAWPTPARQCNACGVNSQVRVGLPRRGDDPDEVIAVTLKKEGQRFRTLGAGAAGIVLPWQPDMKAFGSGQRHSLRQRRRKVRTLGRGGPWGLLLRSCVSSDPKVRPLQGKVFLGLRLCMKSEGGHREGGKFCGCPISQGASSGGLCNKHKSRIARWSGDSAS